MEVISQSHITADDKLTITCSEFQVVSLQILIGNGLRDSDTQKICFLSFVFSSIIRQFLWVMTLIQERKCLV